MKVYSFKLKHDKGITSLQMNASNEQALIKAVTEMENCPPSAIFAIQEIASF